MPQLEKGGKWVFGWVIVGPQGEVKIPPEAFSEYGFQIGEPVVFLRGSLRSGGFSLGRPATLSQSKISLQPRMFAQGFIENEGGVSIPPAAGIPAGARLLVYRGSGLALGFLAQGPIYMEAQKHQGLQTFDHPAISG